MIELGVNIDHIATLRQARRGAEPDPLWAAVEAELGGADGITVHLREDRRHIQDHDVQRLGESVHCKLNLEMSLAPEIVEIALRLQPYQATLVPERRQEVTTEGGIDLSQKPDRITDAVMRMKDAGIVVSAFIDPDEKQITLAAQQGFDAIELHTGEYANASGERQCEHLDRLMKAAALAGNRNLRLHAGHGLNYHNVGPVAAIPRMRELNIGHAIISRALFIGLREAVALMKSQMTRAAEAAARADHYDED